jgi:AcrR family transcriptional regulator
VARKRPLTRERILETALRLADDSGIESLSMRKLARDLGVEAMSLYNHVANKGDLVDGIVDLALLEIELPAGDEDWDVAIRRCAISAHEAFLRHPWACSLVMSSRQGRRPLLESPRVQYMEWLLGRLRGAGFSADLTYHAYHTLDSHILGFTFWQLGHSGGLRDLAGDRDVAEVLAGFMRELRAHDYGHLVEHAEQHLAAPPDDGARQFAFGLDLILDGLKRARARV